MRFFPDRKDPATRAAFRYCRWLTGSAGSHFSLSFLLLPPARRRAMEAVYAYCRALDDVVDREGAVAAQAQAELERWRSELRACQRGHPTHPITVALAEMNRRFSIPVELFERLIAGVEMDLRRARYETFEELRVYCERVASVVGLISVRVFGCASPAADEYATSLGIALQLTNILRDLKVDGERGRVYLPGEELRRFGLPEPDLLAGRTGESFRRLMAFECGRARGFFEQAERIGRQIREGRKLLPARIMGRVYRQVLEEIGRSPESVFAHRISVPRARQVWTAARCLVTSS
ncbi:MAG: presqualene diphosphate synthase HpnD [Candidatus Omnitrophica bacterium]|nr:presqualene diphosphate synthase HpnD [Candidatus Omnitrophota bacterium]